MRFEVAGKTDPGCVRKNNEDGLAVDEDLRLLVVADGMGGHRSGEVASALAIQVIRDNVRKLALQREPLLTRREGGLSQRGRLLEGAVKLANQAIYEASQKYPEDQGMGTTVSCVWMGSRDMTVAHVGDSRVYVFRSGELQLLTEDHSLVMDQVKKGLITKDQAEKSEMQNILIRALGTEADVMVDVEEHPLLAGDIFLLCSDGLTKMVSEEELGRTLGELGEPVKICDRLIDLSRSHGGLDNVTVVVARILKLDRQGFFRNWVSKHSPWRMSA